MLTGSVKQAFVCVILKFKKISLNPLCHDRQTSSSCAASGSFSAAVSSARKPVAGTFGSGHNPKSPYPVAGQRGAPGDSRCHALENKGVAWYDVIFVVKTMNVSGGWAWVHTLPRSVDGFFHYEDFSALLHNDGKQWLVDEIACTEPDNPHCIGSPGYFRKLSHRFPCAPLSIFPTASFLR